MTMEESFPRGRQQYLPADNNVENFRDERKKKNSIRKSHESKKRHDGADFLFGSGPVISCERTERQTKRPKVSDSDDGVVQRNSLLPLGGGGVVSSHGKGGDPFIEPLGFSKLHSGFQMLSVVREVSDDLAVFSLPNHWTGFMIQSNKKLPPCNVMLQKGQILSVVIVKAIQEATEEGSRRRIEVSCLPDNINLGLSLQDKLKPGTVIRGQIKTIEDHGLLVDLGFQQRGFLSFDDIEGDYFLLDEEDYDGDKLKQTQHVLGEGRILDFIVKASSGDKVTTLGLMSQKSRATFVSSTTKHLHNLHSLQPGILVQATVEALAKNGLCVSFANGAFRGAIEAHHLGSFFFPENRQKESDEWRLIFDKSRSFLARILALDTATKIVRLSLMEHILDWRVKNDLPAVGTIFHTATVLRCDPGVGALLALRSSDGELESLHPPPSTNESFLEGRKIQVAYVHISKAFDGYKKRSREEGVFVKDFAPTTRHTVRIMGNTNLIDGISSGATAPAIVNAHVFSFDDLVPGQVYKQVPVCANLERGSVVVELGLGVRGLIPDLHLFDENSKSQYRSKIQKIKYAVGAKVDVRVLAVDIETRKCILTAKKSLVNSKHILTSFEDLKVGQAGTGFVSKVGERGLHVSFFNGVFGFVPNKTLRQLALLGSYRVGDVIECHVLKIRRPASNEHAHQGKTYEVILSLSAEEENDSVNMFVEAMQGEDRLLEIQSGQVLPQKCLRVVDLTNSLEKNGHVVPGFAIVEVETKHLTPSFNADMPELVECKLPFHQLADDYEQADLKSPTTLNHFAERFLRLGEVVDEKSIILSDPRKSVFEYRNGIGKLPVISLRKKVIQAAESEQGEIFLPKAGYRIVVGAVVMGYVTHADPRYGAFVRFLDEMTGLVPKVEGGLDLRIFTTVKARVLAVDSTVEPPKVLLSPNKVSENLGLQPYKEMPRPFAGDMIKRVAIEKLSFHTARVRILDDEFVSNRAIHASIHCLAAPTNASLREDAMDGSDDFHSDHPFHRWRPGMVLSQLKVMAVREDESTGAIKVDLCSVDCDYKSFELSSADVGVEVRGIVSSVDKDGISVLLGISAKGYIPVLEASDRLDVVQKLDSFFPVGKKISARIMDRQIGKLGKKQRATKCIPLTLLEDTTSPPPTGTLLLGRVNRRKKIDGAPHLVLELPGGKMARCCITELADPDEWVNFPLGNILKRFESHGSTRRNHVDGEKSAANVELSEEESAEKGDSSEGGDSDDETNVAPESGDSILFRCFGHYPPGKFLRCSMLGSTRDIIEVSCRKSRLEGILDCDEVPSVGDIIKAYVVYTNKKGCFLRVSRSIEGRVLLKELSDGFIPEPSTTFLQGRLVLGKVRSVNHSMKGKTGSTLLDVDLRESNRIVNNKWISFSDVKVGDKYMGIITRIEQYGAFVRLDNSDVTGLVHKSECSDNFVADIANMYNAGDCVRVLVIRKMEDQKKLGLSMKPSHFMNDDRDEGNSIDGSEAADKPKGVAGRQVVESKVSVLLDEEEDREANQRENCNSEEDEDSDARVSSSHGDNYVESSNKGPLLDTNISFNWGSGKSTRTELYRNDEDKLMGNDSDEPEESDNDEERKSRCSKKTQAERRRQELLTSQREAALADGTADKNPESTADFERLLASQPNSSELWIRYMAFHLTLADVEGARQVAEKAFSRIEFREEKDKLNVWCALLTLETKYGSYDAVEKALARACGHVNPKHIHLRLCEIFEKEGSADALFRVENLYSRMCKKFRTKKTVWLSFVRFLLSQKRNEEAFSLSKRALLSLPKYKHSWFLSHFGQSLYEKGNSEHARAVFDALLRQNPKRVDLLSFYMDQELKHGEITVFRQICARVSNASHPDRIMKLSDKQMKNFFKRWFTFEESSGTESDREAVKMAAEKFVEDGNK